MVTLYNVGSHLHRMVVSLCENGDENRGRSPELLLQKICSIKQYFGIHFSPKQGASQEKKMRSLCSIKLMSTCQNWCSLSWKKWPQKAQLTPWSAPSLYSSILKFRNLWSAKYLLCSIHLHGASSMQGGLFLVFSTQYCQINRQE